MDQHNGPLWPFPGSSCQPPREIPPLPSARFAIGDRVKTRWGRATVIAVHDWDTVGGSRAYTVKHDWSDAPPDFGHLFGEEDCELARPEPVYLDDADPEPAATKLTAQGKLF